MSNSQVALKLAFRRFLLRSHYQQANVELLCSERTSLGLTRRKKYLSITKENLKKLEEEHRESVRQQREKVKELSKQTKRLKRKQEQNWQAREQEEERRRLAILEERRQRQLHATDKFQRLNGQLKGKRSHSNESAALHKTDQRQLKDGLYHIRGFVVEIKNGKRVSNEQNAADGYDGETAIEQQWKQPVAGQHVLYTGNRYLNHHVHELVEEFGRGLSSTHANDSTAPELNSQSTEQAIVDSQFLTDRNQGHDPKTALQRKESVSSIDSLDEEACSELKSSMKRRGENSGDTFMPGSECQKRVTFSARIQYDDGRSIPLLDRPMPPEATAVAKATKVDNDAFSSQVNSRQQLIVHSEYAYPDSIDLSAEHQKNGSERHILSPVEQQIQNNDAENDKMQEGERTRAKQLHSNFSVDSLEDCTLYTDVASSGDASGPTTIAQQEADGNTKISYGAPEQQMIVSNNAASSGLAQEAMLAAKEEASSDHAFVQDLKLAHIKYGPLSDRESAIKDSLDFNDSCYGSNETRSICTSGEITSASVTNQDHFQPIATSEGETMPPLGQQHQLQVVQPSDRTITLDSNPYAKRIVGIPSSPSCDTHYPHHASHPSPFSANSNASKVPMDKDDVIMDKIRKSLSDLSFETYKTSMKLSQYGSGVIRSSPEDSSRRTDDASIAFDTSTYLSHHEGSRAINENKHTVIPKKSGRSGIPLRIHSGTSRGIPSKEKISKFMPHPPPAKRRGQSKAASGGHAPAEHIKLTNTFMHRADVASNKDSYNVERDRIKQKYIDTLVDTVKTELQCKQNEDVYAVETTSLDKTPTDDEINLLWKNVRNCLHKPASQMDQDAMATNRHSSAHSLEKNRTLYQRQEAHSVLAPRGRPLNDPTQLYLNAQQHIKRYDSLESLSTISIGSNNPPLLKQRAKKKRHHVNGWIEMPCPSASGPLMSARKSRDVSDSLISFMEAEYQCQDHLDRGQSDAVLQAYKTRQGQERKLSTLSMEENKVLASLERLDAQLLKHQAVIYDTHMEGQSVAHQNGVSSQRHHHQHGRRDNLIDGNRRIRSGRR